MVLHTDFVHKFFDNFVGFHARVNHTVYRGLMENRCLHYCGSAERDRVVQMSQKVPNFCYGTFGDISTITHRTFRRPVTNHDDMDVFLFEKKKRITVFLTSENSWNSVFIALSSSAGLFLYVKHFYRFWTANASQRILAELR